MVYRIAGGIGLLLLGIGMAGLGGIPGPITGAFLVVGAIGLLAGI
jgi:hypothetical protein